MKVTTQDNIAGMAIEETLGAVRGTAIWSRRVMKNSTAGHRALEHMTVADIAEGLAKVREEAQVKLMAAAKAIGADAVVALRIDLVELGNDMYQAFACGTAVRTSEAVSGAPAATVPAPAFAALFKSVANDGATVLPFQRRAANG